MLKLGLAFIDYLATHDGPEAVRDYRYVYPSSNEIKQVETLREDMLSKTSSAYTPTRIHNILKILIHFRIAIVLLVTFYDWLT